MGATLILTISFCHGYFSMGVVLVLGACTWACHGLGNIRTGTALALAACPLEGYFPK